MKLGYSTEQNRFLTSWNNSDDPTSGDMKFSLLLPNQGLHEFYIWNQGIRVFRSGPWDGGMGFSGMPGMWEWHNNNIVHSFTENEEEAIYTFRVINPETYSKLTLNSESLLQLYTWNPDTEDWSIFSRISLTLYCDAYRVCGTNMYCDEHTSPICNCIEGFVRMNPSEGGGDDGPCVRKTSLSCTTRPRDYFIRLTNVKLPETTGVSVFTGIAGLKECEEMCQQMCNNCTAYAIKNIRNGGSGPSGCVIWTSDLLDIRKYDTAGQDLYVKVAAVDKEGKNSSGKTRAILGLTIGAFGLLLLISFIVSVFWKRQFIQTGRRQNLLESDDEVELPLMEYEDVAMATNDFSNINKLGEGGFGPVYKGRLVNGAEIAVKKLSDVSTQGTNEFRTEMILIAKLQHINLVRLVGCFADNKDKILVYEYLENLSLDYYLFDKAKSCELNWQTRFNIINGIARGLLYLHKDSRCRVIHRDLKASNILLDKDMTPKISDFGLARIFARDEEEATTRRIVGTHGYMAPEYRSEGVYSEKTDVFSFGVLMLEIITGKKNRGFTSLSDLVWRNLEQGTGYTVLDPNITDSSSPSQTFQLNEILRCIIIGLTCVQEFAEDRPMMSWVVLMLGSDIAIPKPHPPGYCVAITSNPWTSTTIDYTISEVEPR